MPINNQVVGVVTLISFLYFSIFSWITLGISRIHLKFGFDCKISVIRSLEKYINKSIINVNKVNIVLIIFLVHGSSLGGVEHNFLLAFHAQVNPFHVLLVVHSSFVVNQLHTSGH